MCSFESLVQKYARVLYMFIYGKGHYDDMMLFIYYLPNHVLVEHVCYC